MRVLVTGAAGSIGTTLLGGLSAAGHDLVAVDLLPAPEGGEVSWHTLDCADPDAVAALFDEEPVDAVVHLAGIPTEADYRSSFASHVSTTAALLDAMVAHRVDRIVYASSNHAVGRTPRAELPDGVLTVDVRPRPDTFYGAAKVAAEGLLSLYADRHRIDAVACRIGTFGPEPTSVRALSTWLSPADACRMVLAALTAPAPGFAVIHGVSANTRGWWDLGPGRALGYEPQDDAEAYAGRVAAHPNDAVDAAHVGGPYTAPTMVAPAFPDQT